MARAIAATEPSAGYINTPPATPRDLAIVKGMLLLSGNTQRDPHLGVSIPPARPTPYVFETKRPTIIAWLAVSITIMLLVTTTRLYLRWSVPRLVWGLDDWLMLPALGLALAYPSLQIAMVVYGGAGKHVYDVSYGEYYNYQWLASIAQISFFVGVGLVKMSITAFNIRLTTLSSRTYKFANWAFMALCGLYTAAAFFLNVFECTPVGAGFDLFVDTRAGVPPTCVGVAAMNTILRAINIVTDWCLLLLPMAVIWKVQMSWAKKARLCGAFGFGGVACVGSVMTLVAKSQLKEDALWNYTGILAWSIVELTVGVLTASLPTLAFLVPGWTSTSSSSSSSANINRRPSEVETKSRTKQRPPRQQTPESDTVGIMRTTDIDIELGDRISCDDEEPARASLRPWGGASSRTQ